MRVPGVRREAFRRAVVAASCGCTVQHDGWPCGTCFAEAVPEDGGRAWRAVLAYRGDYDDSVHGDSIRMATRVVFGADGAFSHHVFEETPLADVRRTVQALARTLGGGAEARPRERAS